MKTTIKQVREHINYYLQNNSIEELETETIKVLRDLSDFPQENKYQIRFYKKVLEVLIKNFNK